MKSSICCQTVLKGDFKVGIRIASEEEPKFEFYTSRLGIGYKNIVPFYEDQIKNNDKVELKMLHFFINTGIRDKRILLERASKMFKGVHQAKKDLSLTRQLKYRRRFSY